MQYPAFAATLRQFPQHVKSGDSRKMLRRYGTTACQTCNSKSHAPASLGSRAFVRHDKSPHGSDAFPHKTLPKVAVEMALFVLAYNLTRVMNIIGIKPLIAALAA
jgi:hypothetical protein